MPSVIASFLGGMGLFFMGLKLTGDGVKKIAGRRFRDLFLKCTRSRLSGAGLGVVSGLVFQSTSAVSLVLASLIGAGATTVEASLPVLLGANAGVAFLVLLAVVDIRILVLLLLGFSGFVVSFEKPVRFVHLAGILFGVGLLLFGLGIVRVGAAPLAESVWFRDFLTSQGLPLPFYFLIGAVACLLLQTSAGVSILAITLAASGIMDGDDALMVIFGSLFGSSVLSRFYAIQLSGARKRLVMGQVLFNPIGLLLFLPLCLVEHYAGTPLLLGQAGKLFPDIPQQLTAINIAFDIVTALVLLLANGPFGRLLTRICPDAPDSLETLAYAKGLTEVSPETALLLINKEQGRLVGNLPTFTARSRVALEKGTETKIRKLRQALEDLLAEIDRCLVEMVARGRTGTNANSVALLQSNQGVLRALVDALGQIVEEFGDQAASDELSRLRGIFLEALDALLIQTGDVFSCPDEDGWELFLTLTRDRGPVMERLRDRYLSEHDTLGPEDQLRLLRITGLFERCIWLLRRLAEEQRRFLDTTGGIGLGGPCEVRPAESPPLP